MRETVKQGLALLGRGRRWKWIVLIGLATLVGVLEAVAALFVYTLLGMVTAPDSPLELPVIGDLRERFPSLDDTELFTVAAIIVAAFYTARSVVYLGQTYLQQRVGHNTGVVLSHRLFRGYVRAPYAFHLRRNSAELIRNAYGTVAETVAGVFLPAITLASESLIVFALATVLVITSPVTSLMALVVLGPLIIGLLRIVQPRLAALGRENQELTTETIRVLQQSLDGIRDIKILHRERHFEEAFTDARRRHARTNYVRALLTDAPRVVVETVLVCGILASLAMSMRQSGSADDALAVLGLFAYAALRLLPSLNRIVASLNYIRFGHAGIEIIHRDLFVIAEHEETIDNAEPIPFASDLHLEGVSFRYEETEVDALHDIDLVVRRGESIGIVGPTGGGKTTLVDIMLGLLAPTAGRVLVDGVDVRDDLAGWQAHLGVVPQTVFLTDDSLRRNIAFGMHDEEIDEEAVERAVRLAQLGEVIAGSPEGLDTVVGERGVRLSGGQRQRVAIARALYRDPDVLIFDEGTSALDNLTEAEFMRALATLREHHTIISVAHRLSTVRDCDQVIVMRGGRIAARGTFDELVASDPAFRGMAG